MAELLVETPEGVRLRFRLAGAGTRAAAAILDLLILAVFALVGFFGAGLLLGEAGAMVFGASMILLLVLYPFLFSLAWGGQTPGKRALGVRVADLSGAPAGPRQLLLRSLFFPVEAVLLIPVPLGLLVTAVTPQRQRIGDLVAGTIVIADRDREPPAEPFPRETWSGQPKHQLPLVPAHAARFDAGDLADLRQLLTRPGLEPRARHRLRSARAADYAARLGLVAPEERDDVFGFLRELFLFLRESRQRRSR